MIWRIIGIILAAVGLYFDKSDFETALLMLLCFLGADILQAMKRD